MAQFRMLGQQDFYVTKIALTIPCYTGVESLMSGLHPLYDVGVGVSRPGSL
jgi:hypothetical protein